MVIQPNYTNLLARRWLQENEMLEEGENISDYNMETIDAVFTVEEQLENTRLMVEELEKQLDERYAKFTVGIAVVNKKQTFSTFQKI